MPSCYILELTRSQANKDEYTMSFVKYKKGRPGSLIALTSYFGLPKSFFGLHIHNLMDPDEIPAGVVQNSADGRSHVCGFHREFNAQCP